MLSNSPVILSPNSPMTDEYGSLTWLLTLKRNGSIVGAVSLSKANDVSSFIIDGLSEDESNDVQFAINCVLCKNVAETVLLRIRDEKSPIRFNISDNNTLIHMYFLKKYTLIAQGYFNDEHFDMLFNTVDPLVDKSSQGISKWIARRIETIQVIVPESVVDDVFDSDYEVYTGTLYPRKFWNEIPNDNATNAAFDTYVSLVCETYHTRTDAYLLSLYDFNDEFIPFDSQKKAEVFIETHDCAPYTLFQKIGNRYEEIYSA